ncbi:hypothetical protein Y032_0360g3446 [Ancylostoma ceylanicum]|uniref:Mos1 transposase HTH domain-containing protein n=1 Tax=Ancylostoma ceylanicum TaxID=53326 RepID=A0A016RWS7_9BILA|nr:hypothetical protein Y032_0360g3446 [Ancylostoma ceylanicum]
MDCVRSTCFYEWLCGTSAARTAANINAAFKWTLVNERRARRCFIRFTEGKRDFKNRPRPGRPQSLDSLALLTAIEEDPEKNVHDLVTMLGCSRPPP